ncbi:MAG: SIS domain-containing protein [Microbacteriaceae bacterium]
MLNFDENRFVRIQSDALALAGPIHDTIGALVSQGAKNLYFLGAGGVGVLMQPAAQLLQRSTSFPVFLTQAAELRMTDSVNLGPGSIVVIPSVSGTTKEAVEILEFSKAKGATVITLTGHADTPLSQLADHNFTTFTADDTSSESFYLQSLVLALSLLCHLGEYTDAEYRAVIAQLSTLPTSLALVKRSFEDRAAALAAEIKDDEYHIITGAGSTWPEAWYYSTCILEEMQWIRTRPVHASDFFHGTLELLEEGVSLLVFKGEDSTRALVERIEAWAPTVTSRVRVIDAAEFALPGVSDEVRGLISHVLIATVLERLSAHLEVLRDHPLTTRRYYKRVAY